MASDSGIDTQFGKQLYFVVQNTRALRVREDSKCWQKQGGHKLEEKIANFRKGDNLRGHVQKKDTISGPVERLVWMKLLERVKQHL